MRVLYVDDDRVQSLLFAEACRVAGGLEVETADSGADALDRVQGWLPEVLVIDLHLPDTQGPALLEALRQRPGLQDVPAILCSADGPAQLKADALTAGFDAFWTKPVPLSALTRAPATRRPDAAVGS